MKFIKVNATQCNAQGTVQPNSRPSELILNVDLIAAISGASVYLKQGDMLNLGGNYYKNISLQNGAKIDF